MSLDLVLFIIIAFLMVAFAVVVGLYNSLKEAKIKADEEILKARADLNFYLEVEKVKKEVFKDYEDKKKKLSSGDNHSRNDAAADILQNNKGN